ncbi:MAG: hypothetical protein ACLTXI_07540, partial [Collinsella sp.]
AATAVAQISKESDLKLQQLERAFKTDPSSHNLDAYCDFLGAYLDSGLAEGRVAQIQRQQYARLLARRCEREDGPALRIRYATALADAGEIDKAEDVASQLVIDASDEQDVWMLCLRLAVIRRDGQAVRRVIDAIDKQHVYLNAENREVGICVKGGGPISVVQHIRERAGHFRWMGLLVVWAVFIAMAAVLLIERAGVQYSAGSISWVCSPPTTQFRQARRCLAKSPRAGYYRLGQDGVEDVKNSLTRFCST